MRPLDGLRHVEGATVLKGGTPAATLERRTDAIVLSYLPHYPEMGGEPVATWIGRVSPAFRRRYRVSTEEVIGALASVCQARPVAALTLLRQVAFTYLSCNGDTTMALALNGRHEENIRRADFLVVSRSAGLRAPAVERMLNELCHRVELWLADLDQLPFNRNKLHKLRRAIEYRRDRVAGARTSANS